MQWFLCVDLCYGNNNYRDEKINYKWGTAPIGTWLSCAWHSIWSLLIFVSMVIKELPNLKIDLNSWGNEWARWNCCFCPGLTQGARFSSSRGSLKGSLASGKLTGQFQCSPRDKWEKRFGDEHTVYTSSNFFFLFDVNKIHHEMKAHVMGGKNYASWLSKENITKELLKMPCSFVHRQINWVEMLSSHRAKLKTECFRTQGAVPWMWLIQ